MNSRRIGIDVAYNNQNITTDIEDFISNVSFTDNLSGQADDITLSIGDREKKWMHAWIPKKGASLQVSLLIKWDSSITKTRKLGYFEIDDMNISGPPTNVSIKGISVPESSSLRGEEKSRSWENTNLKKIAGDISKKNGLSLHFSGSENPVYDRVEQESQTDLSFLGKLCVDAGFTLKIANKKMIILDEAALEKEKAVETISMLDPRIKDYGGKDTLNAIYRACKVTYTTTQKKTISYTYTPPNPPKTNRILVVNEEVTSKTAAINLAKKSLRNANKEAATFSLRLVGFLNLYSGQTIELKDFGSFSGKYLITSVSGAVGAGSETSLELRRCLEGY